ncbi:hypothetical protein BN946_scf184799.g28 [Trametes cinnabarina]|uniref:Mitochondrial outer membrane transport complex Sam37/metaxin N-terminal domain-containing protein n=1 Tax=Pycnoporus cinnabarinus TaxID=5643 RepID=A0A060S2F7_PYCCI|nr:hypothetical protein BN946_scf184799.g28 [Trametes cinnabarina]
MSESKLSPRLVSPDIVLHVWPRYKDVLSLDPSSVAALLLLQLALPGHFSVAYCANPDLSPSGQLPFLTQGLYHASGLSPIIAYVRRHPNARNLDAGLSPVETAQLTARIAHIDASYGDLVNHMLYSLQENWADVTRPALISMLPVPQRYYVPARIRESHKARLEAVELWDVPEVQEEEPEQQRRVVFGKRKKHRPDPDAHHFKKTFNREQVVEKARALFDAYDRLLGVHQFFMGCPAPTTLDVLFAAHSHILLDLRLPDPLVTSALESYPRLVAHCRAVLSAAFPPNSPFPPTHRQIWLSSLRCLIPWPRAPTSHRSLSAALESSPEARQIERRYRLWRWGFIAGSVLASVAYLYFAVSIVLVKNGDLVARIGADDAPEDEEEPEEGEDGDEGELEPEQEQ